jgi:hypothetical protein
MKCLPPLPFKKRRSTPDTNSSGVVGAGEEYAARAELSTGFREAIRLK